MNDRKDTRPESKEIAARELTDAELRSVQGGFNPQPEPPAAYSWRSRFRSMFSLYR